jgi:hypothetical protein
MCSTPKSLMISVPEAGTIAKTPGIAASETKRSMI